MSVPLSRRKESRFEAQHHFINLRNEITKLMLNDFGFSYEKYLDQIEKYRKAHESNPNVDEVVARWTKKAESFHRWFIDKECDAVLSIMREIESEFTFGNSIYPSETPAKIQEFCERRKIKAYKRLLEKGVMTYPQIEQACRSWMGSYARIMSKEQIKNMKALYQELFGKELKWKKGLK